MKMGAKASRLAIQTSITSNLTSSENNVHQRIKSSVLGNACFLVFTLFLMRSSQGLAEKQNTNNPFREMKSF